MAQRFSYDDVYKVYAWREDNVAKLVLTQGEGLSDSASSFTNTYVKTAKFQLRDDQGIIAIPSDTAATLALKKRDGTEALIEMFTSYTDSAGLTADKNNGIVTFAIKRSMTNVTGEMSGEIRLTTSTGIIKFYGIRFFVCDGVSNSAAEQSEAFSALVAQTNKVEALLENADSFGNLTNLDNTITQGGTHPATSGVIYDFVTGNFTKYQSISPENVNSAFDSQTLYHTNNPYNGTFANIIVVVGTTLATQYRFTSSGGVMYRKLSRSSQSSSWDYSAWGDWKEIVSTDNIQNSAVTTAKIGDNQVTADKLHSDAVTTAKILNANVTPEKLDRTYTEFKSINFSDVDSATTNGIIYKTSLDGRTNYLFCVNSGSNLSTQYRFDTQGYAKYRTRSSANGSWSEWYALVTTQNIQNSAVTTAKIGDNQVTVAKLNVDDPDTLVQLLEGKAIYYHKKNNQAPAETMYVKYPIPTLWFTGSKYYLLSGRTNGSSSGSWNYTINKIPSDSTIAGLSLHNSISASQLKTALGYAEVHTNTRVPTDSDSGVIGDLWVAKLTDSNSNVYYELYRLARYFADPSAPTATRYCWEKEIYASQTNRVTIWDAATSSSNNFIVSTSQVGEIGDIIVVTTASGTGGAVWQLVKIVSNYGTPSYYWEQQVFVSNLTEYMKKSYSVNSGDIADVPSGQLFMCQGSIALKTGSLATDYIELVKMATLNAAVERVSIYTFAYTLAANGWNNSNEQTITVPSAYTVSREVRADIDIDSTAFTQLVQDGCTGLYITSVKSGSTLTLTAHAMDNAPTAAVNIQVTLTPIMVITT